jgi:hypothetical protein
MKHNLNWSVTIVSSAQEAVIRTNEIMGDSWYCVWWSEELGSCIHSLRSVLRITYCKCQSSVIHEEGRVSIYFSTDVNGVMSCC